MTTFDLDEHIIDALRAGASGFLVKDAPPEELIRAVRLIADGQALLAPSVTRRLLDLRGQDAASPCRPRRATPRWRRSPPASWRCSSWWPAGCPTPTSPHEMDLAPSSVKTHVGHLLAKLGFTDRVQLVVFAYEHELVRPGARLADETPTSRRRPSAGSAWSSGRVRR